MLLRPAGGPSFALTSRPMEFLEFLLILSAGLLVLRRPQREGLAFGLLVACALLNALLFFVATRPSILPPVNY